MKGLQALIMAAGQGTRMKSRTAKVLHHVVGMPMIGHVVQAASTAGAGRIIAILGHQREEVQGYLDTFEDLELMVALQEEQHGTAHAISCALSSLSDAPWTLILSGDVPNFDAASIQDFIGAVTHDPSTQLGLVTAKLDDPARYGRIIRTQTDAVARIVEYRDASPEERAVKEINAGMYLARTSFLRAAIEEIMSKGTDNAQSEYYLTDIIELAARSSEVRAFVIDQVEKIQGVNTRKELASAETYRRRLINERWMVEGVTMLDPSTTYIEESVRLAHDVTLGPSVTLAGQTSVAPGSIIEQGSHLRNSWIGPDVHIKPYCVLENARVEEHAVVGPFARLRPGADLGPDTKVGNFVEVKKTRMEKGAKASHLTYLGDAHIGENANVGAGTITCNYDGKSKHQTTIGAGAFIGSNSALVAPVQIGEGAYVGAGSTIVSDIPENALGVGRARQRNIAGWAKRKGD